MFDSKFVANNQWGNGPMQNEPGLVNRTPATRAHSQQEHNTMPPQQQHNTMQRNLSPYINNPNNGYGNTQSPGPINSGEGDTWQNQTNVDRNGPGGFLDRQLSYMSASNNINNNGYNRQNTAPQNAYTGNDHETGNVHALAQPEGRPQVGVTATNHPGGAVALDNHTYGNIAQQQPNIHGTQYGYPAQHPQSHNGYQRSNSNEYYQQQGNVQRMYSADPSQQFASYPSGSNQFIGHSTGDPYAQQNQMDVPNGYAQGQPVPAYRTATSTETEPSYGNTQAYPDSSGRMQTYGAQDMRMNTHPYAQNAQQPQAYDNSRQTMATRTYTDQTGYTPMAAPLSVNGVEKGQQREMGYTTYQYGNENGQNNYSNNYGHPMNANQGNMPMGGPAPYQDGANYQQAYRQDTYSGAPMYNSAANAQMQPQSMDNAPNGYTTNTYSNLPQSIVRSDGTTPEAMQGTNKQSSPPKHAPYNDIRASSGGGKRSMDASNGNMQNTRDTNPADCSRQAKRAKSVSSQKQAPKTGVLKKKSSLSQSSGSGETASHICGWPNCGVSFNSEEALASHVPIHTGDKPHECLWVGCSQKFLHRGHLNVHLRAHTGFKPYMCEWEGCEQKFSVMENMKRHMRTHTGEKPFTCDHEGCGKRFSYKGNRTKHQRVHKNAALRNSADQEREKDGGT